MKEVLDFLRANPMGCLATIEKGKPRVRPWGFMLERDGKLWFCTANTKAVYRQLRDNPWVEFATSSQDFTTLRIRGEMLFSNDLEMKTKILESSPIVKRVYHTPDNPIFEILYMEHGEAVLSDFSGQPPRVFQF